MPILERSLDRVHPVEGDGGWSESCYFSCCEDAATGSRASCSGSSRDKRIEPSRTIVSGGLATWTYEGRAGTGVSGYLHRLDEDAEPVVPIQ